MFYFINFQKFIALFNCKISHQILSKISKLIKEILQISSGWRAQERSNLHQV